MSDEWRGLSERGRTALDDGRLADAEAFLRGSIAAGAQDSAVWFNLGLVHKLRREWSASLEANTRAAERDGSHREAWWNMGVAATALREWVAARRAWAGLGIDVGEGDGPPEADFGLAPVRLNATSTGEGEVVWGRRIDPCRMRIQSVPLPESGHRWGDIVLHDVVPRGERMVNGSPRSVFDELGRMEPSPYPTHVAELVWSSEDGEEVLFRLLEEAGLGGEDWSASIRFICSQCSLAEAHVHAAGEQPREILVHRFGLAGPTDRVRAVLARWVSGGPGRLAGEAVEVG